MTRLIDMGVEPFLLSSACSACSPSAWCASCARSAASRTRRRRLARRRLRPCGNTGFQGRSGIYELVSVNDEMRMLVHQGSNDTDMRRVAEKNGMIKMRADAQRWVQTGVTSQEETLRVTRE